MYCQTCGAEVSPGLNFCNRCGIEIGRFKQSSTLTESLIWAIVAVTVAGIGVIIGLIAVMKNVAGLSIEVITVITLIGFFMILAVNAAFIRMLLKGPVTESGTEKNNRLKQAETQKLLEMPPTNGLNEPIPSVVEDTTRNLEPVLRRSENR